MGTLILFLIPLVVCHKEEGDKLESARNHGADSRVVPATSSSWSPCHSRSSVTAEPKCGTVWLVKHEDSRLGMTGHQEQYVQPHRNTLSGDDETHWEHGIKEKMIS